jgi:hypothetical protein
VSPVPVRSRGSSTRRRRRPAECAVGRRRPRCRRPAHRHHPSARRTAEPRPDQRRGPACGAPVVFRTSAARSALRPGATDMGSTS